MPDDRQEIIQVLISFFTEECELERACGQNLVNDSGQNTFNKYCTPKKLNYGDYTTRSYGYDGVYNYDHSKIDIENIEINRNKAIVTIIITEPF